MKQPDDSLEEQQKARQDFQQRVDRKSQRILQARRAGDHSIWFGLGTMGLVGWAVTIPTLLGIAIGIWIDTRFPSPYSWTLMLLFLGIVIGCFNAWYWVQRENRDQ